MSDKKIIEQLSIVLKKSRGEPSTFIELIAGIRELNQESKIASCSKIIRKLWPEEWQQAQDKVNFEKVKWDLLCKRRRTINNRVLKSHLCFNFYIELTPEKQFLLIHDPEDIYVKRVEELERNLAKASSESLKERIKAAIKQLEYQFDDFKKGKSKTRITTWKWSTALALVVLLATVVILVVKSFYFTPLIAKQDLNQDRMSLSDLTADVSIAVLPFYNMTDTPELDYFTNGITEEITTTLSKLPEVQVIDRSTTNRYQGNSVDVQDVRKKLGARYVLQGSIRKTDDRARITAQLSDAVTGHHLWADRWDRNIHDVFEVQDDITMKIVTELVVILKAGGHVRLFAKSTRNLAAFTKVMAGYHYFFEGSLDDTIRARRLCEEAISIDPNYVAAYALLADTYVKEVEQDAGKPRKDMLEKAFNIIDTALKMDDSDALVRNILSRVYTFQGRLDLALSEAQKAVDIYPNSVECINWQGLVLIRLGRYEEAIKQFNRSLSLNPKDPSLSFIFLGLAYTEMRRYEEAIRYFEKFLVLKPKSTLQSLHLAALYMAVGRDDEGREIVQRNLSKDPTLTISKVLQMGPSGKDKSSNSKQLLADYLPKAGLP